MPPIEWHKKRSLERTGKDHRTVHEWLDGDPTVKAARHDLTKMIENGRWFEENFGQEELREYVQHLHDDVKARFEHLRQDLEKAMAETLAYFGVR